MPQNNLRIAPPSTIWVCGACGKTAEDRYGLEGERSRGWDASCMLNAVLCHREKLFDEWRALTDEEFEQITGETAGSTEGWENEGGITRNSS